MDRTGAWIQTYSGVAFYPLDPRPEEILIEDIAHALAMQCRFTGHVKRFYSVAEHSVHVSRLCPAEFALWGLLHDASEAYLCDVARPVKRMPGMEGYRAAEAKLMDNITARFGLDPDEPAGVKLADTTMLGIEVRDLMHWPLANAAKWQWCLDAIRDCQITIRRPWGPEEAEERFLDRFRELTAAPARRGIMTSIRDAASALGRHAAELRRRKQPSREERGLFGDAA